MTGRVVLVHGLWMNAMAMWPLAWRLRRCGFEVTRFSYRSVGNGLAENAARLARLCADAGGPVHLVGHSLGGLTILAALSGGAIAQVGRVVLIGSPYGGSAAAMALRRFAFGERIIGRSLRDWLRQPAPPVPAGLELGVIAGNLPLGIGRMVARLQPPHDGAVSVEETRVPGARDAIVLPVSHSGMLVSAAVARAVCRFLKHGRFADA